MSEPPSANTQLPFDLDGQIDPTLLTAHAEVPFVFELFRRVGAVQVVNDQVRIKQRQRGLMPAQLVENSSRCGRPVGIAAKTCRPYGPMPSWPPCWAMSCRRPPRCGTSWRRFMLRIPRCSVRARRRLCQRSRRP